MTRRRLWAGLVAALTIAAAAGAAWYFLRSSAGSPATVVSFEATSGHELWRVHVALTVARPVTATSDKLVLAGVVQASDACAFLSRGVILDGGSGRELSRAENPAFVDPNEHGNFRVDVVTPGSVSGAPEVDYMRVGDRATGAEWQVPVDRSMVRERGGGDDFPFAASDGRAYAFARPDTLTAYEAQTGTIVWQTDAAVGHLAAGGGYVFISSIDKLTAMDSTGAVRWSVSMPGPAHLIEAGGRVYAVVNGRYAHRCDG